MKTLIPDRQNGERGFMVIVLLAILSLLVIYSAANVQILGTLDREIEVIQKKQIQRFKHSETQLRQPESVKLAIRHHDFLHD